MTLRICQVIPSINLRTGGTAVSVAALAEELGRIGVDSSLATLDYVEHGPQTPLHKVQLVSRTAQLAARRLRGWSPAFKRQLHRHAGGGLDLVHNHGLWMFPNLYARQIARQHGLPLVISPRGMVEDWALKRGRIKKRVVWHLFEHTNLKQARLLHATSAGEAESLRRLGLRQPIILIPNGVDMPLLEKLPERSRLEAKFPELSGKKWLLFLSRLHPKKGLEELLRAWARLQEKFPDWHLVIAGPDLTNYRFTLQTLAAEMKLEPRLTFTGMLTGDDKRACLGHASLFVLPTHSENFGLAIAEALSFGVPVVTTHATPWSELESERCGWWIEDNESALVAALSAALSLPLEVHREMGCRGRVLMEKKYSWGKVAGQMLRAYQWCLGKGPHPDGLLLE